MSKFNKAAVGGAVGGAIVTAGVYAGGVVLLGVTVFFETAVPFLSAFCAAFSIPIFPGVLLGAFVVTGIGSVIGYGIGKSSMSKKQNNDNKIRQNYSEQTSILDRENREEQSPNQDKSQRDKKILYNDDDGTFSEKVSFIKPFQKEKKQEDSLELRRSRAYSTDLIKPVSLIGGEELLDKKQFSDDSELNKSLKELQKIGDVEDYKSDQSYSSDLVGLNKESD